MRLPLYGKGIVKTRSGHLRYSSPRELRNKYVHRVAVEKLLDETPYSVKLLLPWPYEVHHQDYNKENNTPGNFLLVSESMHSAMTADRGISRTGKYGAKWQPQWTPPPDYVLFDVGVNGGDEDMVPF